MAFVANFIAASGNCIGSCGDAAPDPVDLTGLSDGSPMRVFPWVLRFK
jgi:hypothetical protein